MAKATKVIHRMEVSPEEKRRRDLEEIETRLLDNKDAVHELFDVLEQLQKREILQTVKSLFAKGDEVMDILVKTADSKETANSIKNLLLMLGTLGTLNVQQLEPLILKVNAGIARVAELDEKKEQQGYVTLLKSLNDPEVKRAMAVGAAFLKGLGINQDEYERTTQKPEHQKGHTDGEQFDDIFTKEYHTLQKENGTSRQASGDSGGSWLIPAGLLLAAIPISLLFKKKS
ncbi:DUF1641 domain-containing protein [Jeotgalibacillus sp. R-1-5s-1]|uniref:DUF1641 domain-containing protein n=1 Tax=Jeotgalibacillus sp. R-1-5s-1 TaxID=2555897 RepID=UPI00106B7610|nr:DUF1641 domain-containing protein [Jeotgalibacillus sp. R-1-5s-1]TFE01859.1 DUF1641 domain-containing protein [Jeotgalibacillus sp. R-1-5s-1]